MVNVQTPLQQLLQWKMNNTAREFWIETITSTGLKLVMFEPQQPGQKSRQIIVYNQICTPRSDPHLADDLTMLIAKGIDRWQRTFASLS